MQGLGFAGFVVKGLGLGIRFPAVRKLLGCTLALAGDSPAESLIAGLVLGVS